MEVADVEGALESQTKHVGQLVVALKEGKHQATIVINHLLTGMEVVKLTMHPFDGGRFLVGTQLILTDESLKEVLGSYLEGGSSVENLDERALSPQVVAFMERAGTGVLIA